MLVSNLVAILSSAFIVVATGLLYPDNYDWATTRALSSIADASTHTQLAEEGKGLEVHESVEEEDEEEEVERIEREECDPVRLQAARRLVMRWGVGGSVLLMVVWPAIAMALGASYYLFILYIVGQESVYVMACAERALWTLLLWLCAVIMSGSPFPIGYWWVWVCLGMGWGIMSSAIITTLPLLESKDAIMQVHLSFSF
jgi:hypothetical protein